MKPRSLLGGLLMAGILVAAAGMTVRAPSRRLDARERRRTALRPFRAASVNWIAVHKRRNSSPQMEGHT